eukprot:s3009_g14.t1
MIYAIYACIKGTCRTTQVIKYLFSKAESWKAVLESCTLPLLQHFESRLEALKPSYLQNPGVSRRGFSRFQHLGRWIFAPHAEHVGDHHHGPEANAVGRQTSCHLLQLISGIPKLDVQKRRQLHFGHGAASGASNGNLREINDAALLPGKQICFFYLSGKCSGENCSWYHPEERRGS